MKAAIFDLDDTLVDSSALRVARASQDWGEVLRRIDEVKEFEVPDTDISVSELPDAARERELKIGLVTHSPSNYARALLDQARIKVDAMITGSDRYPPKPAPAGLIACASDLGVEPSDCVYIGDSEDDFKGAAQAGMSSIGVSWGGVQVPWRRYWPDVSVSRPARLIERFDGEAGLGPLAEMITSGTPPRRHWGSIMHLGDKTYSLGRYFRTTDTRTGALSRLILDAKDDASARERLAVCFEELAEARWDPPPDVIAAVPPSPDKADRFGAAREKLSAGLGVSDGTDILRQLRGQDDYKAMDHDARAANVKGRFEAESLNGERVLLLDDVYTSGSQAQECRRVLLEAGAESVAIVAATLAQDPLERPCPVCGDEGGVQVQRLNRYTNEAFLGCTNYFRTGCDWTQDLPG